MSYFYRIVDRSLGAEAPVRPAIAPESIPKFDSEMPSADKSHSEDARARRRKVSIASIGEGNVVEKEGAISDVEMRKDDEKRDNLPRGEAPMGATSETQGNATALPRGAIKRTSPRANRGSRQKEDSLSTVLPLSEENTVPVLDDDSTAQEKRVQNSRENNAISFQRNEETDPIHSDIQDEKYSLRDPPRQDLALAVPIPKSAFEEVAEKQIEEKQGNDTRTYYFEDPKVRPVLQHNIPAPARAEPAEPQESTVTVSIGRVEIKAISPKDPLSRAKFTPPLSLSQYMEQRKKESKDKR